MRVLFLAILAVFLLSCAALFNSCAAPLAPAGNALSVYDIYSVARDRRSVREVASDKLIQTKIQSKILFTKGLSSWDLEVECFYGEVYLIGLLDSEAMREPLLALARQTEGVRRVHTYLRVKKPEYPCNSFEIFTNLKKNLFSDTDVSGTAVRVAIVGCDVVFSGVVTDIEHEKHAIWYATHAPGVQDVYSFLRVVKE